MIRFLRIYCASPKNEMKIAHIPKDNGETETIILKDNQEVIIARKVENGEDKYLSHRVVQSPSKEFLEWYAKAGYSTNASAGQWAMWEAWQAGRALSAITNTRRGKSDPSSAER